ncbi:hypothetical protein [Streptomyces chartreusis]
MTALTIVIANPASLATTFTTTYSADQAPMVGRRREIGAAS